MEVWVEMISGRERFRIGNVAVNLSEYASVKSETRRYLLQDSKMNSTIKVTISVVHVEGVREYISPPLKKVQMFHGITNLLENKDIPQISRGIEQDNSKNVLHSPTQEMYRRTFAAQWRLQAGELPPSDVVEDIFKGGSGWKSEIASSVPKPPERKLRSRAESASSVRPAAREVRRPLSGQYSTSYRYQRTHIPFSRPITPLSPDDQSDEDDEDVEEWLRQEVTSHRTGHFRTLSMVTITPRQPRRTREKRNVITSESWEKEELETGPRSWKAPDPEVLEDKIEQRRSTRESRSTNGSSYRSAPGSSGKVSSTDHNGSIPSETIAEDEKKKIMEQ
jgi:N-terminal C2 in EEIG1 and EHBP1 proteins